MQRALLLLVVVALIPRAAAAQGGPLGPEFRVNTFTPNSQSRQAVASDSSGNFVVVWTSYNLTGYGGIFGQRYANTGDPLGSEFRVNTYTTDSQFLPAVASDSSDNFVVVWTSDTQDGSSEDVFGQRYANTGEPLGPEFRVNRYTPYNQFWPAVASDSSGNFVVVWTSDNQYRNHLDILGRRYASTGAPLGSAFRVITTFEPLDPAVASDASGNFVVVWWSRTAWFVSDVFGQRFASTGAPLGPQFRVNTYAAEAETESPAVASDPSGNFVVVWHGGEYYGISEIFGQRYASTGAPLGGEFLVNTYSGLDAFGPSVASDSSGNFVVAWNDGGGHYGLPSDVFARRYARTGAPLALQFRVNTYTTNSQSGPAVASDASGNFVVVWQSGQPGDLNGVFGQRFSRIAPGPSWHPGPTDPVEP